MLTEKTRSTLSPSLKLPNTPKEFLPEPKPKPPPTRNLNYIKEIIISSADDSTTHGIDHYFKREHPFIRFVWATCFLVSAAVCFYMIAMSIVSYLNYETVTKAQQISELTADFPAVSFCNLNPYLTNSSWDYVEKILVENGFISALAPKSSFKNFFNDYLQIFRFLVGINSLKPNLTDKFRKTLGFDLNETLLSCTYNMAFCSAADFEWYYDLIYGNCYKFNTGKFRNGSKAEVRKSSKAGSINGLTVELFLYKTNNPLSLSTESGAHVLVHNKSDKPAFFKGLGVGSGLKGSIEVERSFTYHLEKPYSNCVKDINENYPSELVKTMLQSGYKYTQQNCFLACYQDFSFKKCACYDMYSQVLSGVPLINATGAVFCTNMSQIFCDVEEYALFSDSDVQSLCGDRCPLECESVDYNMFASYTDYPSEAYAESLMLNAKIQAKYASNPADLTYDSLKRNLVQVSVYYGDLGYVLYEELENMSLEDLISNIGGTLGLFLGMSFLSFMEILDVILQIIFYKKPSDNNKVMP